jgi:cytochrome b6-f complex iron-sulfur subunit
VAAGNVRDVPVGYFALLKDHAVILARDGSGLYAMTSLCTHFRCDLRDGGKISAEGIACDCHGSRFGRNGEVLEGPAGAPLAHYAVNVSPSGDIVVLAGTEVKSDARTAPPVGM